MQSENWNLKNNYYTKIDHTKIYVDYTNKLVKILDLSNISIQNINRIIHFSAKQHLSKIICNCDYRSSIFFIEAKFQLEGKIEGFFKGKTAFCMSYFIGNNRKTKNRNVKKELIVKHCMVINSAIMHNFHEHKYIIRDANKNDLNEMIKLFTKVFSVYPCSANDKNYLEENINKRIPYKVAVYNSKIVGIASAAIDKDNLNAEIRDCATDPLFRCRGILSNIICSLESDLKNEGLISIYSLSKSTNVSINMALCKLNYKCTGKLINNCIIGSTFYDMNIWVKLIHSSSPL